MCTYIYLYLHSKFYRTRVSRTIADETKLAPPIYPGRKNIKFRRPWARQPGANEFRSKSKIRAGGLNSGCLAPAGAGRVPADFNGRPSEFGTGSEFTGVSLENPSPLRIEFFWGGSHLYFCFVFCVRAKFVEVLLSSSANREPADGQDGRNPVAYENIVSYRV